MNTLSLFLCAGSIAFISHSAIADDQDANAEKGQQKHVKKMEERIIPSGFDYAGAQGLSLEAKHKLSQIKPATLGQASRINGITPSDITVMMILLRKTDL